MLLQICRKLVVYTQNQTYLPFTYSWSVMRAKGGGASISLYQGLCSAGLSCVRNLMSLLAMALLHTPCIFQYILFVHLAFRGKSHLTPLYPTFQHSTPSEQPTNAIQQRLCVSSLQLWAPCIVCWRSTHRGEIFSDQQTSSILLPIQILSM